MFQKIVSETGKACLPMAERWNGGTVSWLKVEVDWSNSANTNLEWFNWSIFPKFLQAR